MAVNSDDERSFDRRNVLVGTAAAGLLASLSPAQAIIWEEGEQQCRTVPPEKALEFDLDDALLQNFMQVSRSLTGMPLSSASDLQLGRQYLERFARLNIPKVDLQKLLAARDSQPSAIMKNNDLRPAAEQMIYLWYISAFLVPGTPATWAYGTTDQYERALIWRVIGAHAPMMPMPGADPQKPEKYWENAGRVST